MDAAALLWPMGIGTMTGTTHLDRRTVLAGAALVGGGLWAPGAALAASGDMKTIRAAIDKQLPKNIARIQDWIKYPGIAAENWQIDAACDFTIGLLRDAGFQMVKKMPTDGHTPAIDGWFDNVRQLSPREKQLIAQTAASNSEAEAKRPWASRCSITTNRGWRRSSARPDSRRSISRALSAAIPALAARRCCRGGWRPSSNAGRSPIRRQRKPRPSCARTCKSAALAI